MANIAKMGAAALVTGILLWVGSAQARDATLKAQEAKLEAQGKLQLCLKKNSAKMLAGKPDGSPGCQMKFQVTLAKIGGGIATTPRYLENGDGTVTDLNTGLQWEKKNNKLGGNANYADPHDAYNVYMWCASTLFPDCTDSAGPPDGTVFTDFLAKLNNGASTDGGAMTPITGCFAGHCDWRLPSIVELQGIVDATQGVCAGGSGACIDPAFGPTTATLYWSATSDSGTPDSAWIGVFYEGGPVSAGTKGSLFSVRAVRGGL